MSQSVPALLRAHGLHPRKRLGQNFLLDPVALGRIVDAAELSPEDLVLEVGAGVGNLTRLLAAEAGTVLALELDDRLVEILREQVAGFPNVKVVHGDVLDMPDLGLGKLRYKVVGNLPYYITSAVLRTFLERHPRPTLLVVTVQREVAERIVAEPGDMSLLAVSVQFYGRPRIWARIPAGAFYPAPDVDSAIVRVEVEEQPQVQLDEAVGEAGFFRVVRAGFSQKRKTLRNSLSGGLGLDPAVVERGLGDAGVDPRRRAETLSLQEWAAVARTLSGRSVGSGADNGPRLS
ncbi:MAG: 16S rRNA (adenine(1518)-N(6)/adenine(1519)-N(6))-dimethyltransferase RsmA [Anaerolineae bacterium]|nr:16S rRNA (adenine(1518)-N(6)/adenine(1519)-N(6))-dimethyltransferase RsmA [Anaerolineae bacterium]